ncbi:hypothetical protein HJC23_006458 [Cyclotella cryptica]|uniref:DUF4126 domain-containing protein n=1 Tax=Cyclotella cryptica TaxID=29204 RepID=A0ABD3QV43_9STRA
MIFVVLNAISGTAFSFTLSGNSGISPFLTMLLIGITQRISPNSFNMGDTMEKIMSSWPGLTIWGMMTVLEFVGKCVPVIDQMVDSVEVFVVPWISTLGSCASFGSFVANTSEGGEIFEGENLDAENRDRKRFLSGLGSINHGTKILRGRTLVSTSSAVSSMGHFFQVILVLCGMVLALSLHFLKMLIRLLGTGCLTQLITICEAVTVVFGVCISVFIRQFSILIAGFLCLGAAYGAKKKYEKWQKEEEEDTADKSHYGRLRRFFTHTHGDDVKRNRGEKRDNYIPM